MSSDRARRSYDESRRYRSVVSQQGRVTLEADANEAEEIRAAEAQAELSEIVGPTGAPGDGFKITIPNSNPTNFGIAKGVLYLGGVRVEIPADTSYEQQKTEWVDFPAGVPATDPDSKKAPQELVYLAVTEQEVSAVEDEALREVALGGPDTAARTRLIARVQRTPASGADCEEALEHAITSVWAKQGLRFEKATMRLRSTLELKVDFEPDPDPENNCQPTAQFGFLGNENQLIRVQVTNDRRLLWGYDNASFLYRVGIDDDNVTLHLEGIPVDVFHQPKPNQWVEVLGTAVDLKGGACIAAATGFVTQLDEGYDPTGKTVKLKTRLSGNFPRPLFLRIWENQIPLSNTATQLVEASGAGTGVRVTTRFPSGAEGPVPGDYWSIGVRPSHPQTILPARLTTFQPPDGPKRWAAPLAVIRWETEHTSGKVSDCRPRSLDLVELTRRACCELLLSPGDNLQKAIDRRLQQNAKDNINGLHVRFRAGLFQLDRPLILEGKGGGDLTVSGCGRTSRLLAPTQKMALLMFNWDSVTLCDIAVEAQTATPGQGAKGRPDPLPPGAGDESRHLGGAITIRNCRSVMVERVVAACGHGDRRAASCLHVRSDIRPQTADDGVGTVQVRSCDFRVGERQIGVLLINVGRATVEDNYVRLRAPTAATTLGDHDRARLRRMLIDSVRIESNSASGGATESRMDIVIPLNSNENFLYFRTDKRLAAVWRLVTGVNGAMHPILTDLIGSIENLGRTRALVSVRQRIDRLAHAILEQALQAPAATGPLKQSELRPFADWLKEVLLVQPPAGQGIVVGGVLAADVRILHNTVRGAMDSIHIGLSENVSLAPGLSTHATNTPPRSAFRVQVTGNTIWARVPKDEQGLHTGIFLGNVESATIQDNEVQMGASADERSVEAIRVWGALDRMLLITRNMAIGANVGIRVVPQRATPLPPPKATRLTDVRILQNTVRDAMDGIRVGAVSTRQSDGTVAGILPLRVQIAGNTVSGRVPISEIDARAGIFLGNVESGTIQDNEVDIEGLNTTFKAIHVWGALGRMLLVSRNITSNAPLGIHVEQPAEPEGLGLRLLTDNIIASNGTFIAPQEMLEARPFPLNVEDPI